MDSTMNKILFANLFSLKVGVFLKTPVLPMWLTRCEGQMGLLFNPIKDIFRNRAAENK